MDMSGGDGTWPPFEPDIYKAQNGQWTILGSTGPGLKGWTWLKADLAYNAQPRAGRYPIPAGSMRAECPRCHQVLKADEIRAHERAAHLEGAPEEVTG